MASLVRVAALSDLHGELPPPAHMPDCELLLIAGDICPLDDHHPWAQHQWLKTKFARWLEKVPAAHVIGIAGNHDMIFAQTQEPLAPNLPWHYLEDESIELAGLRIHGTPWIPWMGRGWVFQDPEEDEEEEFLAKKFAASPAGLDILLAHTPPAGGPLALTMEGEYAGSAALAEVIERTHPRLVVCGHIHEGRGIERKGASTIANVSSLDWDCRPQKPMVTVFDIPTDRGRALSIVKR
jgi:Icc-related predicted phosphoesterase